MSDENEKKPDLGLALLRWGAPELFVEEAKPATPPEPPDPSPAEVARMLRQREEREEERENERDARKIERAAKDDVAALRAEFSSLSHGIRALAERKDKKGKKKGKRS